MPRLSFGAFLAPHHPIGEHPMLQFRRDLDLVEHLDALGYDEFWCGEHHSSGWEMIGSPEMFLAAAGERTKRIKLATGVVSLPYHHPYNVAQRTHALAYSPDGRLLAAASGTPGSLGEVKLFDPNSGQPLRVLGTMSDEAFDVAFSPKGDKLAACAADRSIRIYDVTSGKEEKVIEDHADWVMAVAWNNDGTRIASASRDKTSKVFDPKTGESQATYNGHGQTVYGVAFSPDGKQVLTAGGDRKVHIWNPADSKKLAEIGGYGNDVYRVYVVGQHVFSCSGDKTAKQNTVGNWAQVRQFAPHADWVYTVAVNPTAKRVATGTFTGEVHVWNLDDGKQVTMFTAAPGYVPAKK